MEFSIKPLVPGRNASGCTVVGVYADRKLSEAATTLDKTSKGYIRRVIDRGDMAGAIGSSLMLHDVPGIASTRVLLLGLGPKAEFAEKQFRRCITTAIDVLAQTGSVDAELHVTELAVGRRDIEWRVMQTARAAREATYRFEQMKSAPAKEAPALRRVVLAVAKSDEKRAARGLSQGLALAHGISLARDLGNLPGNVCTPAHLAEQARKLAKHYRFKVQVLERADMEKLGMNTLLSVAAGSSQPPKLIVLEYRAGPKTQKPVVLVGKGVTFDTGGISLKPAPEMDEMKYDMSGAG
ncbi:MAG: leucyl aminopeptidase family protein, partial [Burkholderiales bacterium]